MELIIGDIGSWSMMDRLTTKQRSKKMKIYAIQFSNYHFNSDVLFVKAKSKQEAIKKAKEFTLPQRFVFERFLSEEECRKHNKHIQLTEEIEI